MKFKSEFLNEINERGFIYQHTEIEDLDKAKLWFIENLEAIIDK